MNLANACTCPPDRNGIDCAAHVQYNRRLDGIFARNPIWIRLAWELDLNWGSDAHRLFWQWRRIEGWEF